MKYNNKCLVKLVSNSGIPMPLFLSCYKGKDFEIVATLCAWMSNGWDNENSLIQDFIITKMLPNPLDFIDNYKSEETQNTFFRLLTNKQLDMLLNRLNEIYKYHGSLEQCFINTLVKRKSRYNHEIFARMFLGGTGFQTPLSKCTFYRFNLLFYWLAYKYKIWQIQRYDKALLPCNDMTFRKAYDEGVTKMLLKSNLRSTKILTQKAKEIYGEHVFFKMYENLNGIKDD